MLYLEWPEDLCWLQRVGRVDCDQIVQIVRNRVPEDRLQALESAPGGLASATGFNGLNHTSDVCGSADRNRSPSPKPHDC
jgi:hypothetical protein